MVTTLLKIADVKEQCRPLTCVTGTPVTYGLWWSATRWSMWHYSCGFTPMVLPDIIGNGGLLTPVSGHYCTRSSLPTVRLNSNWVWNRLFLWEVVDSFFAVFTEPLRAGGWTPGGMQSVAASGAARWGRRAWLHVQQFDGGLHVAGLILPVEVSPKLQFINGGIRHPLTRPEAGPRFFEVLDQDAVVRPPSGSVFVVVLKSCLDLLQAFEIVYRTLTWALLYVGAYSGGCQCSTSSEDGQNLPCFLSRSDGQLCLTHWSDPW